MPRPPKFATRALAAQARAAAQRKYATPDDAKEARRQQTRQWRHDHRREKELAEQQAIARLSLPRPPARGTPAKYVPRNTHCPGSVAFEVLYGTRITTR